MITLPIRSRTDDGCKGLVFHYCCYGQEWENGSWKLVSCMWYKSKGYAVGVADSSLILIMKKLHWDGEWPLNF